MAAEDKGNAMTRRAAVATGIAVSGALLSAEAARALTPAEPASASQSTVSTLQDAWAAYNAAVEKARLAMEATPRFKDRTDHRATAYYSLSEAQSMAYEMAVVPGSQIACDTAGSPSTVYTWGIFDIQEDEALILEYDEPQATFWSLQVQDVWTKPINYLDHQSDINQKRAVIDPTRAI
jgi:hypothetical protein